MTFTMLKVAAVAAGCLGWDAAQAATTCNFGASPGITIPNYTGTAAASVPTSVTVNCTRANSPADPNSTTYTVTLNTGNNVNRAAVVIGASTYYITYSKAAAAPGCAPAITTFTGTFTWPNTGNPAGRTGTKSATHNYAGCVAAQPLSAAATHTDTIGLTLTHTAGAGSVAGTAPVSITRAAQCTVSQAPSAMTFIYTAFRGSPLVVPSTFGVTCTNTTPYTLSFGTASTGVNGTVATGTTVSAGTAAGLAYSLALNTMGTVNGTGLQQLHTITGTMGAGQPGDCTGGCTGSNTHNVVVTY